MKAFKEYEYLKLEIDEKDTKEQKLMKIRAKNWQVTQLVENLCEEFDFEFANFYMLKVDQNKKFLESKELPFTSNGST